MHAVVRKSLFFTAFFGLFASSVAFGASPSKPAGKVVAKKSAAKATAGYVKAVKNWHAVEGDEKQPVDGQGRPELVIYSLNTRNKIALRAASDRGGFSTRDLDTLSYVLREPSSGNQHPIDPALADLVYRIQTHFDAPEIRVVSCYRTPRRAHSSNHGRGRAIDIIVPGATDDAVAKFAREQGFVGVGLYPTSGFVHVDVRSRSYFLDRFERTWPEKSRARRARRPREEERRGCHRARRARSTCALARQRRRHAEIERRERCVFRDERRRGRGFGSAAGRACSRMRSAA